MSAQKFPLPQADPGAQESKGPVVVASSGDIRNQVSNPGYIAKLLQARDVYGDIYFGDVERLEPMRFPWEYQEYLRSVYTPSDQVAFDRFDMGVRRRGYGYIVGQPGSGRETAAVALLAKAKYSVQYVLLEANELDQLLRMPHRRKQGYVIDLSNFTGSIKDAKKSLISFWYKARRNESVVLVIIRPEQRRSEPLESTPLELVPVSGIRIFASHLEHLTGKSFEPWELNRGITNILSGAKTEEAVRLARIAADLHFSGQAEREKEWISETLKAHGGWEERLAAWFGMNSGKSGVWSRVVLAACALLEGAAAEKVLEFADRLAERLGLPPGDAGGFYGAGVDSALKEVDAGRDEGNAVRFGRYQYAAATLDYIWEQHPRIRIHLFEWSSEIFSELDNYSIGLLADAWAGLVVRQEDHEWVNKVFNRWVKEPKTLLPAVVFGSRVAVIPGFGQRMRRRLYDIADDPANPTQARSVALICRRFGKANPASALVRLKRLSNTDNAVVQKDILATLDALGEDDSVWNRMVREVVQWACDVDKYRSRLGMRFLLGQLTDLDKGEPRVLKRMKLLNGEVSDEAVRSVALMWSALFDTSDSALVSRAAEAWIPLAMGDGSEGVIITEALLSAVLGESNSSPAQVTSRSLTMSHAIGLWWKLHENQSSLWQESVWELHAKFIRVGAEYRKGSTDEHGVGGNI